MNKKLIHTFFLLLFCLAVGVPSVHAATVEGVSTVIIPAGGTMPTRMQSRMAASINTVGEHVFLGKSSEQLQEHQGDYEKIIREVAERVLVGYTVQSLSIVPGTNTRIQMQVTPWGDVVQSVTLHVNYGNLVPAAQTLICQDLTGVAADLENSLTGLPVDAMDWAGGVSKVVLRDSLEEKLPEFQTHFEIQSGIHTIVNLYLVPRGPVVQNTQIVMRSQSIPNLFLLQIKPDVSQAANTLNGLPVAFVQRHQEYFTQLFAKVLQEDALVKRFSLQMKPQLFPGVQTVVQVEAGTDRYHVSLEARVDMLKDKDNTSLQGHIGKYVTKDDELYLEPTFIASSVKWQIAAGWEHHFGPNTWAGAKYDFREGRSRAVLHQRLAPRWQLRAEQGNNYKEIGIRYRLDALLSAEYVMTDSEQWLRLVGHL